MAHRTGWKVCGLLGALGMGLSRDSVELIERTTEEAVSTGLLMPVGDSRRWLLTSRATRVVTALKTSLTVDVAQKCGLSEWIFPRLVSKSVVAKTGWLVHHSEQAYRLRPEKEHGSRPMPDRAAREFATGQLMLDPLQCVSFYAALAGRELKRRTLPLAVFEHQGGWTWRNESNRQGFYKAADFLRFEMVWIGLRRQAQVLRLQLVRSLLALLANRLRLPVHVAKGESCFTEAPSERGYADFHL